MEIFLIPAQMETASSALCGAALPSAGADFLKLMDRCLDQTPDARAHSEEPQSTDISVQTDAVLLGLPSAISPELVTPAAAVEKAQIQTGEYVSMEAEQARNITCSNPQTAAVNPATGHAQEHEEAGTGTSSSDVPLAGVPNRVSSEPGDEPQEVVSSGKLDFTAGEIFSAHKASVQSDQGESARRGHISEQDGAEAARVSDTNSCTRVAENVARLEITCAVSATELDSKLEQPEPEVGERIDVLDRVQRTPDGLVALPSLDGATRAESPTSAGRDIGVDQSFPARLIHQISSRAKFHVRQGEVEMTMRVDPPHLGTLRLSVVSVEGTISATIHTDSTLVRHTLESGLLALRESLAEAGLNVDTIDVQVGGDEAEAWSNPPDGRRFEWAHPDRRSGGGLESTPQAVVQSVSAGRRNSVLNYLV